MVKMIIVLIAIQYFIFLFTVTDKSVRLSVSSRAGTHLSITVAKRTFTYFVPCMVLSSFIRYNTVQLFYFSAALRL